MSKKNIILITVDCLRADHVNYMEKLMERKDKIVFENMFSNATYTGLSIPSMLTSKLPPIECSHLTITTFLKEAGYSTAAFNPNALLLSSRYKKLGIDKDFTYHENYLEGYLSTQKTKMLNNIRTGIKEIITLFSKHVPQPILKIILTMVGLFLSSTGIPYPRAEKVLEDANKWLNNTSKEPFFLWVHLMDVHQPYLPPERFRSIDTNTSLMVNRKLRYSKEILPEEDVELLHRLYIDSIRYVDDSINKFIENINTENTVVIITADHGDQFLEHGGISHLTWNLYDEQLHIPLVILTHGGGQEDKLVSLIDISPTIAQLAGLDIDGFIGNSVLSKDYKEKPVFFAGYDKKWNVLYGIRTKEWKLFRGINGWELYDLKKDPYESNNIYSNNEEIALNLKGKLLKILEEKNRIVEEDKKLKEIAKKLGKKFKEK